MTEKMTRPAEWFPTEAPPLYATEEVEAGDKIVVAHYTLHSSEWFVVEYDPDSQIAFGYCVLNGDALNSEWGYVSLAELSELTLELRQVINGNTYSVLLEVERNRMWTPTPASEVREIQARG